tara:strand:- start:3675 stop:3869 length:195 start_codon:yes stop_codon:yes gene_type:complete
MIYYPDKELTADQLSELPEDEMFAYLDAKATYLKQFTATDLPPYHKRLYATMNKSEYINKKQQL